MNIKVISMVDDSCIILEPTLNKLKNSFVYLAGPIDRCPNNGRQWREEITPFLKTIGCHILDPLNKKQLLGYATEGDANTKLKTELKQNKEFDRISTIMKEIRVTDLRLVDLAHFLIVNLDNDIHSCGTWEEVFWANRCKKPILVHMKQGKSEAPDWLFGTIPHQFIFESWDEVKNYIANIDNGIDTNTYNRWVFLNTENI